MKVIVAGSRGFNNYNLLKEKLSEIVGDNSDIEIVSGMARGADLLGVKYANEMGYEVKEFPAQWDKYGKSAGYKRNAEMAQYADICICFWDGLSKGTKHMIDLANKYNSEVHIIKY